MNAKEYQAKINNMYFCAYKNAICPDCNPFDPECEACSLENVPADERYHAMKEAS